VTRKQQCAEFAMDSESVIERTRRWIADVVIGLNLCPFARRVFDGGLIRYVVTDAADVESLRTVLSDELQSLAITPAEQVETAFLIHPQALADFRDYNDFVVESDDLIAELGLEGIVQIASFHPQYQFAGTRPDDVENYTNRSPFPMLHLLREDSISKVNDDPEKLADIPQRNIETLRRLGLKRAQELARGLPRANAHNPGQAPG
jgi:hypothetical protein